MAHRCGTAHSPTAGTVWLADLPYPVFAIGVHIFHEDCPMESGPTAVVPGSHTSDQPPPFDQTHGREPDLPGTGCDSRDGGRRRRGAVRFRRLSPPVAAYLAAGLYVLDHMFFALSIAIETYFQKIADPAGIASTAGVSFTINHIAAVVIPALLGLVWLESRAAVFLIGAGFALLSLVMSQDVPRSPRAGNETVVGWAAPRREAAR